MGVNHMGIRMVDKKVLKAQEIATDFLSFQISRFITLLFKRYLEMNEDLKTAHDEMMQKIKPHLSDEQYNLLKAADCFTDEKFRFVRKTVLDCGNSSIKELNTLMERFDIAFNGNYLKKDN